MSVRDDLKALFDPGSWKVFAFDVETDDPLRFPGYDDALAHARVKTGLDESVLAGTATVQANPVAFLICDFSFIGGSMGVATGERIALAFEEATTQQLPMITLLRSGGARMHEGMVSLVQMPKTVAAEQAHAGAGLLHVTICGHPTTGGMYASFGSLGDVVLVEPGATIGFAGPMVARAFLGRPLDSASHTAQAALTSGSVDAILDAHGQRNAIAVLLRALRSAPTRVPPPVPVGGSERSAWDSVLAARAPDRPSGKDVVDEIVTDFFRLRGDRVGGTDDSIVAGIGRIHGRPVGVVAQDRRGGNQGYTAPPGYRLACRTARLSERLGIPLVTFVDTPGALPDEESERTGLATSIAETFACLLSLQTPVVTVCVGEGGSGGALALSAGDVLAMQAGSVFSVIAPEGAATILHRDRFRASEVAELLHLRARDLVDLGIADEVVADDLDAVGALVARHLDALRDPVIEGPGEAPSLAQRRASRWRRAGSSHLV